MRALEVHLARGRHDLGDEAEAGADLHRDIVAGCGRRHDQAPLVGRITCIVYQRFVDREMVDCKLGAGCQLMLEVSDPAARPEQQLEKPERVAPEKFERRFKQKIRTQQRPV
jgi:hypothetical protein